jgi:transcriptional regulator with XRE-family HTH domain
VANQEEVIAKYTRDHIRLAREERQMSQNDLARSIGKTNVTISDIERGKVGVSSIDLALIAKKLGRPMDYFIPWKFRVRVNRDELKSNEARLVHNFRRIDYTPLEDVILHATDQLAVFSESSESGQMFDEAEEIKKIIDGKD